METIKDTKTKDKKKHTTNSKKSIDSNNKKLKRKSTKEASSQNKAKSETKKTSQGVNKNKPVSEKQALQKKPHRENKPSESSVKKQERQHSKHHGTDSDKKIAAKKAVRKKEAKKKRKRIIKKLLSFSATLIVFVIMGYCGYGYAAYSDMFMPGTTVNGIECGNVTSSEFIDTYNNKINNYSLAVKKNGDAIDSIKASDVKLTSSLDMPKKVRAAIQAQNKLKWALGYIWENKEINIDSATAIDDNVFDEYIKKSDGYNLSTTVENKELSIIFEDGKYCVSDAVYGDEIDKEAYAAKVKENMLSLNSEMNLEDSDCYTKPDSKGNKENYEKACDEANNAINYGSLEIIAEGFNGDLTKEIIEASLVIDDNFNVSVNKDTIAAAIKKISDKYNTMGTTRKFKTSHGTVVNVEGGDYGCSLNIDDVGTAVENALLNGKDEKETVKYKENLLNSGTDGIGSTYVEIDLTNQYVWVYKAGKLVAESPCVSGLAGGSRETPQGTYMLKNKMKDVPLVGENYVTPVAYWMPFNGGIGLHDATWQPRFGGELYKTRGSHGCINLPLAKAGEIYDQVVVKMPVVLYYDTRLPEQFKAFTTSEIVSGEYKKAMAAAAQSETVTEATTAAQNTNTVNQRTQTNNNVSPAAMQ